MSDWRDWEKVALVDIKHHSCTLEEFLKEIKILVPEGTKEEDIQLDFEVTDYDDYNDYGEKYTIILNELRVSIKKKVL